MSERYDLDELLGFERDFDLASNRGETECGATDPALHVVPGGAETSTPLAAGHAFLRSNNPRVTSCARCGRPADAHDRPELRKAALISAFDMASKAVREGDEDMARVHGGVAMRLLEGRT